MKKKVKVTLSIEIAFIIALLIVIITLITIKTKKYNSEEYNVVEFNSSKEFDSYVDKKIDINRNKVIKLERFESGSMFSTTYTYFEVYINVEKENIYICEFTSGCFNQFGTITTNKISKDAINKLLSLENEEVPEPNQEDSLFGLTYWILEYKDKKIYIVNMPEELQDIFYQIYEDS